MIPKKSLKPGELITLLTKDCNGLIGIVSQPITEDRPGHVLIYQNGCVLGVQVSIQDVMLADKSSEGFAQLAYNLIRLASRVIEARLIV